MERFFQILAVILAGVAAYFLWEGNAERAFVAAVLGAVSFFLSVRVQVKERLRQREEQREEEEERGRGGEEETDEDFEEEIDDEIDDENSDSELRQLNEIPAKEQIRNERRTTNDELKGQRTTDSTPKI